MADVQVFSHLLIEELTGDQRTILLSGGGLPAKGAAWAGTGRAVIKFPPGSLSATEQILGPEEAPSEWSGRWLTTQLSRTPALVSGAGVGTVGIDRAFELAEICEDVFRTMQRLRVTWSQTVADNGQATGIYKRVRRGYATAWSFNFDRADDVAWSVTFKWGDRGDSVKKVSAKSSNLQDQVQAVLQQMRLMVADLEDNAIAAQQFIHSSDSQAETTLGGANPATLGVLESLSSDPTAFFASVTATANLGIGQLSAFAGVSATATSTPQQVASSVQAVAVATAGSLFDTCDAYTSQVPDSFSTVDGSPARTALLYSYFAQVVNDALAIAQACQDLAQACQDASGSPPGQVGPDVLAVYLPIQGDTFGKVSVQFYSTPDLGPDLATANGYLSYTPAPNPGQVLVVPTKQALAAASQKV